ncbi:hypothetical protein BD410DRAFT_809848 [Rickenella mellea]|uniref:Ribonuclease H1 N-terminal domain-containing protein n=1 Tax=Rickenella mellea TaxID=50990 RepID=A0A4Y7PFT5_9AGAM|nr:hypothetical protein BD410DRAFT_809848 [Rickenella mellea]
MVDLTYTSDVQQNGNRGDDDDDEYSRRTNTAVNTDSSSPLMVLLVLLRALLGILQAGFTALAAAPAFVQCLALPTGTASGSPDAYPFPVYYATARNLGERWYAVYVGNRVGVFNDWADVADATSGVLGNSQRRFGSQLEAIQSFRAAHARGHVRYVPRLPPPPANTDQNAAAGPSNYRGPPDDPSNMKPRTKKEESDDDDY